MDLRSAQPVAKPPGLAGSGDDMQIRLAAGGSAWAHRAAVASLGSAKVMPSVMRAPPRVTRRPARAPAATASRAVLQSGPCRPCSRGGMHRYCPKGTWSAAAPERVFHGPRGRAKGLERPNLNRVSFSWSQVSLPRPRWSGRSFRPDELAGVRHRAQDDAAQHDQHRETDTKDPQDQDRQMVQARRARRTGLQEEPMAGPRHQPRRVTVW